MKNRCKSWSWPTSKKCKIVWLSLLVLGCLLLGIVYIPTLLKRHENFTVLTYLKQPLPFNKDVELIRYFNTRGFDASTLPDKAALWTRNVQLCIMFNSVIKNRTIGLLLSYYLQFFNHITILSGTKVIERPNIIPNNVQFFNCDSYYGRYQQRCMTVCMENPGNDSVEGFLYIADDMFVNFTKLGQLNRTKLWTIPIEVYNYTRLIQAGEIEKHWRWSWFGFPRYVEIDLQKTIEQLPQKWIQSLRSNAGFPDHYETVSTADIYYIPSKMVPQVLEVMHFIINTTYSLFNEVALPLTVGIVTHPSQRELLADGYLWKFSRTPYYKEATAKTAHFVHPLKISQKREAELWIKLMNQQLQQVSNP